jgi:hypothetical protein
MAELKEFVGGVVQKLPQPCKLVVVGGAKSTMQLHFACARTGETVTTETKEWGQWCKVGFGLLKVSNVLRIPPLLPLAYTDLQDGLGAPKLGKCAVSAAVGNPVAIGDGVSAIKDVYNACKGNGGSAGHADFNTFIKQVCLRAWSLPYAISRHRPFPPLH